MDERLVGKPLQRLTTLAKGGGCACKLAPDELAAVMSHVSSRGNDAHDTDGIRVEGGLDRREDAAVIHTGGTNVVFTVDFFTPVVDDPFEWGRIAAANALSDVYAMGGRPFAAMNLLAWPREHLSDMRLAEVLRGGDTAVRAAGAAIVGGHSIDDDVPKYGLAVLGTLRGREPLRNRGARPGDSLVLTKPLGVGTVSTAIRRGAASPEVIAEATAVMAELNAVSGDEALAHAASACTDVTGFGLLGHLFEMMESSGTAAEVYVDAIPVISGVRELIEGGYSPTGAGRNERALSGHVDWAGADEFTRRLLCDPQSSGGLLIAVPSAETHALLDALDERGVRAAAVARVTEGSPGRIALHLMGRT